MNKVSKDRDALLAEAEKRRIHYARIVREMRTQKVSYLDHAAELPQHLIDKCRLVQNRRALLKLLPKGGVFAEVGSDTGSFAKFIYENCRPRELHIFELDVSRLEPKNIEKGLKDGTIFVHEGKSSVEMQGMPNRFFDWIYIDGDHRYEGVKRDIEAAVPKLKEGGYLVFNDYTTWSPSSMSHCGVARAVNEFCIANEWELVYLAFQSMMYNDVAIRKKAV